MTERKLVKASTYAERKGVSRGTVYYWINTGRVPYEVIDGQYFIVVWENPKKA